MSETHSAAGLLHRARLSARTLLIRAKGKSDGERVDLGSVSEAAAFPVNSAAQATGVWNRLPTQRRPRGNGKLDAAKCRGTRPSYGIRFQYDGVCIEVVQWVRPYCL